MSNTANVDLRSLYSMGVLKRGLVSLLHSKPLDQITISELCKSCGIYRGTFYHHYSDIRALYHDVEQDFFEQIEKNLDNADFSHVDSEFFSSLLRYFKDHLALSMAIYSQASNSKLMVRIWAIVKKHVYPAILAKHPDFDTSDMDDLFVFLIGGVFASIMRLLKSGKCFDVKKSGNMLAAYTNALIERYLSKETA